MLSSPPGRTALSAQAKQPGQDHLCIKQGKATLSRVAHKALRNDDGKICRLEMKLEDLHGNTGGSRAVARKTCIDGETFSSDLGGDPD